MKSIQMLYENLVRFKKIKTKEKARAKILKVVRIEINFKSYNFLNLRKTALDQNNVSTITQETISEASVDILKQIS